MLTPEKQKVSHERLIACSALNFTSFLVHSVLLSFQRVYHNLFSSQVRQNLQSEKRLKLGRGGMRLAERGR